MNINIKKKTFKTIEPVVKKVGSSVLKGGNKLLKGCIKVLSDIACEMDFKAGYLDFVSRPDDIFVVTYPRSGTTWMQMILYQLTTDGSMDFNHICEVSPWFERLLSFNVMEGKDFEKFPSPRIIKTHLPFQEVPKGPGKYIYVARNGKDVAVSYYHLYKSHRFYQGSFDDFFKLFIKGKVLFGSWFKHVADWRKHRNDHNVLFLEYEDLLKNFGACLQQIIEFCDIELSPERLTDIEHRCSFDFMKQYEDKFDPTFGKIWELSYQRNSFIRKGEAGSNNEYLTTKQLKLFEREFGKY